MAASQTSAGQTIAARTVPRAPAELEPAGEQQDPHHVRAGERGADRPAMTYGRRARGGSISFRPAWTTTATTAAAAPAPNASTARRRLVPERDRRDHQHASRPGQDEGEPADERAGAAGDPLGAIDRHLRRAPGRAAGCTRRTRPRTRAGRSTRARSTVRSRSSATWRAARRSRARRSAPHSRATVVRETRGTRPILTAWDGSSTCPTSRRRARSAAGRRPAARRADAAAHARGVRRPGAPARAVERAADRDPVRRAALDDPLRAAGHRQDDAGADARRVRRRGLRGALARSRRGAPRCAR